MKSLSAIFRNPYAKIFIVYLCLVSLVGMNGVFSRYTSTDSASDSAGAARYDVVIYDGTDSQHLTQIDIDLFATARLSEPESMEEGTYEFKQVNIINRSDCRILLSDFELTSPENSAYTKLLMNKSSGELDSYLEALNNDRPTGILYYVNKPVAELADIDQFNSIIEQQNAATVAELNLVQLSPGETKTFYIVAWAEHDNLYKSDAGQQADAISHKTPTQLSLRHEEFRITLRSVQAD